MGEIGATARADLAARGVGSVIRARVRPPPLPTPTVHRPRVEQLFAELVDGHRLLFVHATAGAGKTTATLQAAAATERSLAWLSTDRTDAATGQLLVYLEAALTDVVPAVAGVATSAMAAGIAHEEAAGLLAQTVGDAPVLVVLDDLERLADAPAALRVIAAFLRYLPATARAVLIGRVEIPLDLGSAAIRAVAGVGEADLAFTLEETTAALDAAGSTGIDPAAALRATGGWVAGVLFEAWRSADHVPGMGGETDPLHGYLSTQILDQLTPAERELLVVTSVLDQVTAEDAAALGAPDGGAAFHALRRRHLPASWDTDEVTLRCHPRFREFLRELLERAPAGRAREVHRLHGTRLAAAGHPEEAVPELIAGDALDQALQAAQDCIEAVIDRADLERAEQWLAALEPVRPSPRTLAGAELMLAVAVEDYRRAVRLADALAASGELADVAGASGRAGAAMAWCYLHAGDLARSRAVLDLTAPGPPREAMEYCLSLTSDGPPGTPPARALSGGSFDALVMRVHYYRGYFALAIGHPLEGWAARAGESWRTGALLDMGRTEEARALFDATGDGERGAWFSVLLRGRLLGQVGRTGEARHALREGRTLLRSRGTAMLEMISYLEEAELELVATGDTATARELLARVLGSPVGRDYRFIAERAGTCMGHAMLLDGENAAAAACLREVLACGQRSDRIFGLPSAGVYLAEAQWRRGRPDDADAAADAALAAADRQGSRHLLMEALRRFPAVLSRRLDAEADPDSPWHALGRTLRAQRCTPVSPTGARVQLAEFGRLAIDVDGAEARPRIRKSCELLAFLIDSRRFDVTREHLLDALFDGRSDTSTAAYLRQAVHQLRLVLPSEMALSADGGVLRMAADAPVASESTRFEDLLGEAAAQCEADRLAVLRRALRLVDQGPYLPGIASEWAELRRSHLADQANGARFDAAETAFGLGRCADADELLAPVLQADPLREAAWRLAMRLADAVGDDQRVLTAYRDCEQALAEIGARPAAATRRLLGALHH